MLYACRSSKTSICASAKYILFYDNLSSFFCTSVAVKNTDSSSSLHSNVESSTYILSDVVLESVKYINSTTNQIYSIDIAQKFSGTCTQIANSIGFTKFHGELNGKKYLISLGIIPRSLLRHCHTSEGWYPAIAL